jgi:hypothetical protein
MIEPTSLIVTLQMETQAAARFTELRQAHFPSNRNWLTAHVTLFHALPITASETVLLEVANVARTTETFVMCVDRVLFLGRGVAYAISSEQGMKLRSSLATRWSPLLGRQDRMWRGPLHITVQNKVEPSIAKGLYTELERDFVSHEIWATGLEVWHYMGGPWRPVASFPFAVSYGR